MATYRVRNWDKWQTYRRDRGKPPWIKVHRRLTQDPNWIQLTDAQRGQLVSIWILAADRDGVLPAPLGCQDDVTMASWLQKLCFMSENPDLQLFVDLGFIERDVNVTSTWRQDDDQVTGRGEGRGGEDREEKNSKKGNTENHRKTAKQTPHQMIQDMAYTRDATDELLERFGHPPWTPQQITAAKAWLLTLPKYTEAEMDSRRLSKRRKTEAGAGYPEDVIVDLRRSWGVS